MNNDKLQQTLSALREEIEGLRLPAGEAERLKALIDHAEQGLDEESSVEADASLVDEFTQAIDRFEVEHPRFTALLGRLVSSLSSMGI